MKHLCSYLARPFHQLPLTPGYPLSTTYTAPRQLLQIASCVFFDVLL